MKNVVNHQKIAFCDLNEKDIEKITEKYGLIAITKAGGNIVEFTDRYGNNGQYLNWKPKKHDIPGFKVELFGNIIRATKEKATRAKAPKAESEPKEKRQEAAAPGKKPKIKKQMKDKN